MSFPGLPNPMADMICLNALQMSNELSHQLAPEPGGEPFPLAPHNVQMQVKGSSGDVMVNMINETAEMQEEFAIISLIEYIDVPATTADLELLL